jgi:hypothetical protein
MQALITATFLLATLVGTADPPILGTPEPCTALCAPPVATPAPPPSASPATPSTTARPTAHGTTGHGTAGQGTTGQGTSQGAGERANQGAHGGEAGSLPGADDPNLWLIAVPIAALLALVAAGAVLLIRRSERRPF